MSTTIHQHTFELGQIVATPGAIEALSEAGQQPLEFLRRHARLEQGALGDSDHAANQHALKDGSRIFSSFYTNKQEKLWIITEAEGDDGHRQSTCLLLPSEY